MNDTMFLLRFDNKGLTSKTWRLLVLDILNNTQVLMEHECVEVYKIDYHKPLESSKTLDANIVDLVCDDYNKIRKIIYHYDDESEYCLDAYKVRMDFIGDKPGS